MSGFGTWSRPWQASFIAALIAALGIAILLLLTDKGLKLVPKVVAVQSVAPSKVRVSWRISNEGSDPAYFRTCTISLGGDGGVAGEWTGGRTDIVFLASHIDESTVVTLSHGSSSSVTAAKTTVACGGIVNAHSGGK
jgi:hypothetical protein